MLSFVVRCLFSLDGVVACSVSFVGCCWWLLCRCSLRVARCLMFVVCRWSCLCGVRSLL